MRRALAGVLAALQIANALAMLIDPVGWFQRVPGVEASGPFNPHFVRDVGLAFLAAGGGLAAFAWRPKLWPAAMAGAAFLAFHAALHIVEMSVGMAAHPLFDLFLVVLPAALAVAVAWPPKE